MSTKLQYQDLFQKYLKFCPYFSRNVLDLKSMFEILKNLKIYGMPNNFGDFCVHVEWICAINLIKPFFILHYPKNHEFHVCWNDSDSLFNEFSLNLLNELYNEKMISFPNTVYNTKREENLKTKWNHNKIEHDIETSLKRTPKQLVKKKSIEETRYYFHPIQMLQIIDFFRFIPFNRLFFKKEFCRFYHERRWIQQDYRSKDMTEYLEKEQLTLQDYIEKRIEHCSFFNKFEILGYGHQKWLTINRFDLWIRIESIFRLPFLSKNSDLKLQMEEKSNKYDILMEKKSSREFYSKYYRWGNDIIANITQHFSSDDFGNLSEFINSLRWIVERGDFNGLENFIDLLLHLPKSQLKKLYGRQNLLINLLQIIKILVKTEKLLEKKYNREETKKQRWFEPSYYFSNEKEFHQNLTETLIKYEILPEDKLCILYEGETEEIILNPVVNYIYHHSKLPISFAKLHGKDDLNRRINLLNDTLKSIEYYFFLDADTEFFAEGKKNDLKGKGVSEDQFEIFYPDFVTVNFSPNDIINSLELYICDVNELKKNRNSDLWKIDREKLDILKNKLIDTAKKEKYEDIVDDWMKNEYNSHLKKPKFAQFLVEVAIIPENVFDLDKINQLPFSKKLFAFFNKIRYNYLKKDEIN